MVIVKLITTLFIQLDFWNNVKEMVLSPFANPRLELVMVMLVIPLFVNVNITKSLTVSSTRYDCIVRWLASLFVRCVDAFVLGDGQLPHATQAQGATDRNERGGGSRWRGDDRVQARQGALLPSAAHQQPAAAATPADWWRFQRVGTPDDGVWRRGRRRRATAGSFAIGDGDGDGNNAVRDARPRPNGATEQCNFVLVVKVKCTERICVNCECFCYYTIFVNNFVCFGCCSQLKTKCS